MLRVRDRNTIGHRAESGNFLEGMIGVGSEAGADVCSRTSTLLTSHNNDKVVLVIKYFIKRYLTSLR